MVAMSSGLTKNLRFVGFGWLGCKELAPTCFSIVCQNRIDSDAITLLNHDKGYQW
jgi:hypothetical protein